MAMFDQIRIVLDDLRGRFDAPGVDCSPRLTERRAGIRTGSGRRDWRRCFARGDVDLLPGVRSRPLLLGLSTRRKRRCRCYCAYRPSHPSPPVRNRSSTGSFRHNNRTIHGELPMADDRDDGEREHTTIVETGGGGGGGVLAVVLLLIVVLVLLFLFRGQLGFGK